MTIQYNNQLTDEQYRDKRYNVLRWIESAGGKVDLKPYTDNPNGGYATIGAGFKIDSNWDAILTALGFDTSKGAPKTEKDYISRIKTLVGKDRNFTSSQMTTLINDLNSIMVERYNYYKTNFNDETKRMEFKFTNEPEVEATFQVIADDRDKRILTKWLGETSETQYSIVPRGNERIALLSLVYNNVIGFSDSAQTKPKSPKLLDALKNGNRAEAWFEIRYNSNKPGTGLEDGIAKRRYYESQLFGLYNNPQSVDAEEAKQTYSMLQLHRDKIYSYEAKYGTNPNGGSPDDNSPDSNASSRIKTANADYNLTDDAAKVQTLTQILESAKNAMLTYLQGLHPQLGQLSVDRAIDIYLDPGRDKSGETFNLNHSATLDARSGDSRSSRDILIGEGGDDKLRGGKGNDILLGGEGKDTYYYRSGDGNDQIVDTGENTIIIEDANGNKRTITNVYKTGANIWTTADGEIKATKNSPLKIVLEDGSTITLGENFQDGDFGIHLLEAPDSPQTNIIGDLTPIDFDPTIEGIQTKTDVWGNVIVDPKNPYPNRNDMLYDTSGNDRIEGGGGEDYIEAKHSGDEFVLIERRAA
ncbi:MAG: hypothetical protein M0Z70_04110 [Nitrospiraceae bacterium]|nr:hypothetical protein [Nitrospiraceae bacterium]